MRYCDEFAAALAGQGLDVMFGVLGDANMYVGDSYAKLPGTRFVATAHEAGAVLMAAGYAAASGRVGAATVTHGAITNCVGALFEAVRGRRPLVLVAGNTARSDAHNLQNLPHSEIVRPTGALYVEAGSLDTVHQDVAAAVRAAAAHQCPVVLDLPSDFQLGTAHATLLPRSEFAGPIVSPTQEALESLAAMVLNSRRPVLLAGRGADSAGAEAALMQLAEMIGAPTATTLQGRGLFVEDQWHLGIVGTLSSEVAAEVITKSDCLLAFGASLSPLTTLRGELLRGTRIAQVDTDPAALGRWLPVDLGVVADVEACASALAALLAEHEWTSTGSRTAALCEELKGWAERDRCVREPAGRLHITDALHRIDRICPPERTLAVDAGRFAHEALRVLNVSRPRHYVHALNIAQIGMSLAYGIGAAHARPEVASVVVIGDGGFMLGGLTELHTAVRGSAKVVVFVMNDGAYGAEYYRFVAEGLDPSLITFDWPDLSTLARALGVQAYHVSTLDDFDAVEHAIAVQEGPILVDVRLDRDGVPDPGAH